MASDTEVFIYIADVHMNATVECVVNYLNVLHVWSMGIILSYFFFYLPFLLQLFSHSPWFELSTFTRSNNLGYVDNHLCFTGVVDVFIRIFSAAVCCWLPSISSKFVPSLIRICSLISVRANGVRSVRNNKLVKLLKICFQINFVVI